MNENEIDHPVLKNLADYRTVDGIDHPDDSEKCPECLEPGDYFDDEDMKAGPGWLWFVQGALCKSAGLRGSTEPVISRPIYMSP